MIHIFKYQSHCSNSVYCCKGILLVDITLFIVKECLCIPVHVHLFVLVLFLTIIHYLFSIYMRDVWSYSRIVDSITVQLPSHNICQCSIEHKTQFHYRYINK